MKLTTKSQAADQGTHGPILLAAWEAGETRVTVGGKEYELVREVEPVEMYTGEELDELDCIVMPQDLSFHARGTDLGALMAVYLESVRDAVLARRVEMLRAMGDEELVAQVADAIDELIVSCGPLTELSQAVLALVREHIEANRPVLTNEIVSGWYGEFCEKSARRFSVDDACQYVAHRAAEYRSNTDALRVKHGTELGALDAEYKKRVAEFNAVTSACAAEVKELQAENERLNAQCERLVAGTYSAGDLVTQRDEANLRLDAENLELRAENERLKGELSRWRTEHACCGSVDELHKKQDEINKLSDLLSRARADQLEKSKELNARLARIKELEAAHSPQPVDDSDQYGILVQGPLVCLVKRVSYHASGWALSHVVSGGYPGSDHIDPTRIFKVTSQPRGHDGNRETLETLSHIMDFGVTNNGELAQAVRDLVAEPAKLEHVSRSTNRRSPRTQTPEATTICADGKRTSGASSERLRSWNVTARRFTDAITRLSAQAIREIDHERANKIRSSVEQAAGDA